MFYEEGNVHCTVVIFFIHIEQLNILASWLTPTPEATSSPPGLRAPTGLMAPLWPPTVTTLKEEKIIYVVP